MASRYFEFYQKKLLVKILEREYIDIKKKSHLFKKKLKRKRKKETLRNLVLKQTWSLKSVSSSHLLSACDCYFFYSEVTAHFKCDFSFWAAEQQTDAHGNGYL